MNKIIRFPLSIGLALGAAPCMAQVNDIGANRYAAIVRHIDPHPTTVAEARQTIARIKNAALDVCGASSFSLPDVKRGTENSICFRDAMTTVMKQIDDPMLIDAYRSRH